MESETKVVPGLDTSGGGGLSFGGSSFGGSGVVPAFWWSLTRPAGRTAMDDCTILSW